MGVTCPLVTQSSGWSIMQMRSLATLKAQMKGLYEPELQAELSCILQQTDYLPTFKKENWKGRG